MKPAMQPPQFLSQYATSLEQALQTLIAARHSVVPAPLLNAMSYALLAGGKRVRPALLLACFQACGGKNSHQAMQAAMSIECMHTYSLIHDDLPCMDDDDLRRGNPTCHKQFDEATAVLAADALQTLAENMQSIAMDAAAQLGESGQPLGELAHYILERGQ